MKISKIEHVINFDERLSHYFSLIPHKHKIYLYRNAYNLRKGNHTITDVFVSDDGLNFRYHDIIHRGNSLCHNFYVFRTSDGRILGIGGLNQWKTNVMWHKVRGFDNFLRMFEERHGVKYTGDEHRFVDTMQNIRKGGYILDYSDGLYLFESKDAVTFYQYYHISHAFLKDRNYFYFYLHRNYDGFDERRPVSLQRIKISKMEFNELWTM